MRIVIAWYGPLKNAVLDACKRSIAKNAPNVTLDIWECPDKRPGAHHRFQPKMNAWCGAVHKFDEDLLLLDADTLVLRDPSVVFESKFDIAHTPRPGRMPYNTGVIFIRPNKRTRKWMDEWRKLTEYWGSSPDLVTRSKVLYGGTDQAAFADMIHGASDNVKIKELGEMKWNLCQCFEKLNTNTGILHLKGHVSRDLVAKRFSKLPKPVCDLWREYNETVG